MDVLDKRCFNTAFKCGLVRQEHDSETQPEPLDLRKSAVSLLWLASHFLLDVSGCSVSGTGTEWMGAFGYVHGEGGGEFSGSRRGTCRRVSD